MTQMEVGPSDCLKGSTFGRASFTKAVRVLVTASVICLLAGMLAFAADIATSSGLTSSLNPSNPGDSVTFTATVTPAPTGGTVTFYDDGVAISGAISVNTSTGG